jgi:hypothetical protein
MSIHTLELVLHDLGVRRDARKAFKDNPEQFLAGYSGLDPRERAIVQTFDIRTLLDCGANPMLIMGYWMMNEGSRSMSGYLKSANGNG